MYENELIINWSLNNEQNINYINAIEDICMKMISNIMTIYKCLLWLKKQNWTHLLYEWCFKPNIDPKSPLIDIATCVYDQLYYLHAVGQNCTEQRTAACKMS